MKGVPYRSSDVPQRLAARPQCIVSNNYVDEEQMRNPSLILPPRPFKPYHLRTKNFADPSKVAPYCKTIVIKPPPIPPKPNHYRIQGKAHLSSRDEDFISTPPTLDEMISMNNQRTRKNRPVTTQPTTDPLRPGRHGFLCPRCRKCTCHSCANLTPSVCCSPVDFTNGNASVCTDSCREFFELISCFRAIKACSYHLSYDEHNKFRRLMSDKPGSCSPIDSDCGLRWTILSCASFVLPCLLIYPMFKVGDRLSTNAAKKLLKGCQCKQNCK